MLAEGAHRHGCRALGTREVGDQIPARRRPAPAPRRRLPVFPAAAEVPARFRRPRPYFPGSSPGNPGGRGTRDSRRRGAAQVAGAIHATRGIGAERFRSEIGTIPVAGREVVAPHRDLADDSGWHDGASFVQQHDLHVFYRKTDRDDPLSNVCVAADHEAPDEPGLGGAEAVHELAGLAEVGAGTARRRDARRGRPRAG